MNIAQQLTLLFPLTISWASATTAITTDGGTRSLRKELSNIDTNGTIDFDSSLSGQPLTQGQLVINKDLTIDASALPSDFTIDANGQSRILGIQRLSTVVIQAPYERHDFPLNSFYINTTFEL